MKTVILAITLMLGLGMVSCGSSAEIDITERLTFEQKNAIGEEFPELTKEQMETLGSIYIETKNYPDKEYLKGITYYDVIEGWLFYQGDLKLELEKTWENEYMAEYGVNHNKIMDSWEKAKSDYDTAQKVLKVGKITELKKFYYRSLGSLEACYPYVEISTTDANVTNIEATLFVTANKAENLEHPLIWGEECTIKGGTYDDWQISTTPKRCIIKTSLLDDDYAEIAKKDNFYTFFTIFPIVQAYTKNNVEVVLKDIIPAEYFAHDGLSLRDVFYEFQGADALGIENHKTKVSFMKNREKDYISVNFPNFFRLCESEIK